MIIVRTVSCTCFIASIHSIGLYRYALSARFFAVDRALNSYFMIMITYKIPENIYIIVTGNTTQIKYTTIFSGLSAAKCNNYNDQNSRRRTIQKTKFNVQPVGITLHNISLKSTGHKGSPARTAQVNMHIPGNNCSRQF